ncbi:hypothetical protein VTL71DRAFT_11110 [Oculimacula yallundae]|uniref:Peptidase A1 domain-containing protein n=1 Tax=Oculimacula yallundae TaxID=86028 RepID=A0ABR4CV60_9HELO
MMTIRHLDYSIGSTDIRGTFSQQAPESQSPDNSIASYGMDKMLSVMSMECHSNQLVLWLFSLLMVNVANSANTFRMTWSTQTFGPDGPWSAIEIKVGSKQQIVSLYPGGIWASHFLSPKVCSNSTLGNVCYAQAAGLYDQGFSSSADFDSIQFVPGVDFVDGSLGIDGSPGDYGTDTWNIGNSMEPLQRMNMVTHDSIWGTLPDGTTYPLTVGSLALGAPGIINQSFTTSSTSPPINATLLSGWLYTKPLSNKILSSNSYSLHIGSVSQNVPPALHFGGFDQNRVLGEVSTQQGTADAAKSIDLVDIGLNVVQGNSPWTFNSLGGLLGSGNSSIGNALPVAISALAPYLHLPKSTCDAIAAKLPVKYQAKYGLYFWDTSDPKYEDIVSSPSCLTFTFRLSQTEKNLTINVPFKLLNLTLTAPLTTTPTSYFPCKAETRTHYQLGRAFLQAAFIGGNWMADNGYSTWWLAQAPGPNLPSQSNMVVIEDADRTISGSTADWASTWKGSWKALAATSGPNTTTTSTGNDGSSKPGSDPSKGLSTGAKAGIGAGTGAIALGILAALLLFLWMRKSRKNKEAMPDYSVKSSQQPIATSVASPGGFTSSTPNSPPQGSVVSPMTLLKPEYRNSGFRPVEVEASDATPHTREKVHIIQLNKKFRY